MPFTISEEHRGLLVTFSGFAAPFEFADAVRAISSHPGRGGHHYHLVDFTEIDTNALFALTAAIGAAHAVRSRAIFGDGPMPWMTALVARHPKMQAIFQAFMDADPRPPGHLIARFSNVVQARNWIRGHLRDGPPATD